MKQAVEPMTHLTHEEAARFADWLEQEADTGSATIVRVEIEQEISPSQERVATMARERLEVLAALTVARKLRRILKDQHGAS